MASGDQCRLRHCSISCQSAFDSFLGLQGTDFFNLGELLRVECDVVAVHVGVPFYLPADG